MAETVERAEILEGRVFRRIDQHDNLGPALSASAIGEILKRRAEGVGLEEGSGGHSRRFRAWPPRQRPRLQDRGQHHEARAVAQRGVARRYIRSGQRWDGNAAAGLNVTFAKGTIDPGLTGVLFTESSRVSIPPLCGLHSGGPSTASNVVSRDGSSPRIEDVP